MAFLSHSPNSQRFTTQKRSRLSPFQDLIKKTILKKKFTPNMRDVKPPPTPPTRNGKQPPAAATRRRLSCWKLTESQTIRDLKKGGSKDHINKCRGDFPKKEGFWRKKWGIKRGSKTDAPTGKKPVNTVNHVNFNYGYDVK